MLRLRRATATVSIIVGTAAPHQCPHPTMPPSTPVAFFVTLRFYNHVPYPSILKTFHVKKMCQKNGSMVRYKQTVFWKRKCQMYDLGKWGCEWINLCFHSFFFFGGVCNCFHKISCNSRSIKCTDVRWCFSERKCTTEYVRFVGIPIDGVTSPPGDNEHQFWDNPCICKGSLTLYFIKIYCHF